MPNLPIPDGVWTWINKDRGHKPRPVAIVFNVEQAEATPMVANKLAVIDALFLCVDVPNNKCEYATNISTPPSRTF